MAHCCQLFSGVGDSLESQPATPGFQRHTAWSGGSWQQMLSEGERCAAGERGPCKGQGRMASRGMAQCGWEPGCFILWVALCPQRVRAVTPSGPWACHGVVAGGACFLQTFISLGELVLVQYGTRAELPQQGRAAGYPWLRTGAGEGPEGRARSGSPANRVEAGPAHFTRHGQQPPAYQGLQFTKACPERIFPRMHPAFP